MVVSPGGFIFRKIDLETSLRWHLASFTLVGLNAWVLQFCATFGASFLHAIFVYINIWFWAFPPRVFLLFSMCYRKMSVSVFCSCFSVAFFVVLACPSCAIICLFDHLFFCILALCMYLLACLIFCIGFMHFLVVYFCQIVLICCVCYCRNIVGVMFSFKGLFVFPITFLLWPGPDANAILDIVIRFVVLHIFVVVVLLLVSWLFFAMQNTGLHSFSFRILPFFHAAACIFVIFLLLHACAIPIRPFFSLDSHRMTISVHNDCPCAVPVFFALCARVVKHVWLTHLLLLLPRFCVPPWPHIQTHPSEPIYIHLHPFTPLFAKVPKTWCPGKFPRPWDPIPDLWDPKWPLLALFLCLPCLMYPNAPIRTHSHPSASFLTRLHSIFIMYTC